MADLLDRLRSALADRYAIEREIGAGGMATVYLAEDVRHHRKVAVKVLRSELAATMGPERFLREIEIAARLQHPHVLPLYDSGEAGGFLFYVMPFVEGESLRAKIDREGELPVGEAVRVLRDVVDALAYAHGQGVVHRDIKPDNVLVSGRHAMVTDFGVAKAVSEATGRQQLTTAGVALGTPAYMAPEQASADPHIDHRADIYAVGVMAYELLAGTPPFTGHTPQSVLSAHVTQAPQPVTERRQSVPPALADVVMRCLEKKPADRYQTAEALLPAFEMLATPSGGMTPTETRPVSAVPRPVRSSKQKWIGGAVVVTALVGIVFVALTMFKAPAGPTLTKDRVLVGIFANETGDPTHDPLGKIIADWLSRGLHGTGFVDVVDERTLRDGAVNAAPTSPAELRALAEQAGAALIVSGNYYLTGDSVHLQGNVLDTRDGSIIRAVGPMTAAVSAPQRAMGELRDRMMGAFANILDPRFGAIAPGVNPPSYQAYQEFVAGDEAFYERRYAEATRRLMNAYRLDTTFVVSAIRAAVVYQNAGNCETVDSIATALQVRRQSIAPYDRYYLDRIVARCHGDYQAHLKAGEEMMRVAPKSPFAKYIAGRSALWVNRVEYGLSILESFDPGESELRNSYHQVLRDIADAHHMLRRYDREFALLERWNNWAESDDGQRTNVRALAALERFDAAFAAAQQATLLSGQGGPFWASDIMCLMANEVWAHGGRTESRLGFEECLRSLEQWGIVNADTVGWRGRLAVVYHRLDRLDDARELLVLLQQTGEEVSGALGLRFPNPTWTGLLGVIAAKQGDAAGAAGWDEVLRSTQILYGSKGQPSLWRAKIALALGNRDQALALLRQAISEGVVFWGDPFHVDPDLAPLFGDPAYEELVAPKK